MNNKELIRCALMGDKQAQEECTAKGIVLPCPLCGSDGSKIKLNFDIATSTAWTKCQVCGVTYAIHTFGIEEEKDFYLINDWNTRPAPPIGRCGECKNWNGGDCYRQELTKSDDFCSYFEPRERLL